MYKTVYFYPEDIGHVFLLGSALSLHNERAGYCNYDSPVLYLEGSHQDYTLSSLRFFVVYSVSSREGHDYVTVRYVYLLQNPYQITIYVHLPLVKMIVL
jgi:hypothetical protein